MIGVVMVTDQVFMYLSKDISQTVGIFQDKRTCEYDKEICNE